MPALTAALYWYVYSYILFLFLINYIIPFFKFLSNSNPQSVYISDLNPETVENIKYNINLNKSKIQNTHASSIDWEDTSTYPKTNQFDYILGSDLIYQETTVPILKNILYKLLKPNGIFLYVAPKDYLRHGLSDFIQQLQVKDGKNCFECVMEMDAPDGYKVNPLCSGDDDDCFLHFHELNSMNYVLYEFMLKVDE